MKPIMAVGSTRIPHLDPNTGDPCFSPDRLSNEDFGEPACPRVQETSSRAVGGRRVPPSTDSKLPADSSPEKGWVPDLDQRDLNVTRPGASVTPTPSAPTIAGKLTHKRVYTFCASPSGVSKTRWKVCGTPQQQVFSDSIDSVGIEHRCCIWGLRRYGGA